MKLFLLAVSLAVVNGAVISSSGAAVNTPPGQPSTFTVTYTSSGANTAVGGSFGGVAFPGPLLSLNGFVLDSVCPTVTIAPGVLSCSCIIPNDPRFLSCLVTGNVPFVQSITYGYTAGSLCPLGPLTATVVHTISATSPDTAAPGSTALSITCPTAPPPPSVE